MRKVVFDIETKDAPRRGTFNPADLKLSVVGIYDSETDTYTSYFEEELPKLWPIIERTDLLIGYNSDHFDIPLLNKYYPGNLSRIKSIDLLREIKEAIGKRVRLNAVAQATLKTEKSADGLKAVQWWSAGEFEKVKQYCLDDVRITKELYDYARSKNMLKYRDLTGIHEVQLDTSSWEDAEDVSMTHTLPF
jgi:DEAD/DEAH box helicase domain-containing protein